MQKSLAYRLFLWSHRWFGLIGGLYFVAFGLTGSYRVFDSTFDGIFHSDRMNSEKAADLIYLPALVASAQLGLKTDRQPTRVTLPEGLDKNAVLIFNMAEAGAPAENLNAYIDPSNGKYKGAFTRLQSVGGFFFAFHHDLYLGAGVARFWMGVAGVLLLILLLSGLYVWWPKTQFSRHLRWPGFRNLYKAMLDLHKLFGAYTIVLMITAVFSGVYISVPGWFEGQDKPKQEKREGKPAEKEAPTLDYQAIGVALKDAGLLNRPLRIQYSAKDGVVQIRKGSGKPTYAYHPETGKIDSSAEPGKEKGFNTRGFLREIHGGDYWAGLGKILTFVAGLLPLFFFISGSYVWYKKKAIRKRTA